MLSSLHTVCHCDLTTLSRHNHPHFQDDEMEVYKSEVKLVSDRARNQILSCLTPKSRFPKGNLIDYLRVWISIGYDETVLRISSRMTRVFSPKDLYLDQASCPSSICQLPIPNPNITSLWEGLYVHGAPLLFLRKLTTCRAILRKTWSLNNSAFSG